MHGFGILAEPDDPLGRVAVRREVDVRELRDGVADALVDRSGHFSAHRVRERNVHVRACHGGRHRLEAVAHRDDDVGLQELEQRRKLEQPEAGRLGHRHRRLAFHDHVDPRIGHEAVALDDVDDGAEAIEQRRGADNDLKVKIGMRFDRAHHRLDAPVVGA